MVTTGESRHADKALRRLLCFASFSSGIGVGMATTGSTLSKLRATEREVRKNLILDAAVRLFATKPFNQVGMRDIASEVGISPASIYRYFSDQDELFVEALVRESRAIEEQLDGLKKQGKRISLDEMARSYIQYLLEHDSFFQMMTHFMVDGGIRETAVERFNATESRLVDVFDEIFRSMGVTKNTRLVSHAFFAALNGVLITFRNYPGRNPEETKKHVHRLAALMAEIFEKGAE
jgi:AcrR family transcriptional regulator